MGDMIKWGIFKRQAQVLQRRTPALGNRPKDADYVAQSRWCNQPATVIKGGKI